MRISFARAFFCGLLSLFIGLAVVKAEVPATEATKNLPEKLGAFRAVGPATVPEQGPPEVERISLAVRRYKAPSGKTYLVDISSTHTAGAAYSLLTSSLGYREQVKLGVVGAAGIVSPHQVLFCKGAHLVKVVLEGKDPAAGDEMLQLAQEFARQLDGESEIPVLVRHVPQWESVGPGAAYAVTADKLKRLLPNQPILDAVSFEGGVEVVVADYESGRLAIVEFNTPQLATANDRNIVAKINELRGSVPAVGIALPSAYRRVGNYAVFVFDAPSEQAANQLIDQVKYQQVVQWLGQDPFSYEQATREFTETTLGVLVAVVKTSGLALVGCLAVGGLFGALLFARRRAQQRAIEAYVDGGAMLRLNIDELTPENDPARMLEGRHLASK